PGPFTGGVMTRAALGSVDRGAIGIGFMAGASRNAGGGIEVLTTAGAGAGIGCRMTVDGTGTGAIGIGVSVIATGIVIGTVAADGAGTNACCTMSTRLPEPCSCGAVPVVKLR